MYPCLRLDLERAPGRGGQGGWKCQAVGNVAAHRLVAGVADQTEIARQLDTPAARAGRIEQDGARSTSRLASSFWWAEVQQGDIEHGLSLR